MNESVILQYYVEGEDEKKLVDTLKTDMQLIYPGKVNVFNVTQRIFTSARLVNLKPDTVVVLIFDTDVGNADILYRNLKILEKCVNVDRVLLIPQHKKLEHELVRACNICEINELLGTTSEREFKTKFIKVTNLAKKLEVKGFDIRRLWTIDGSDLFNGISNDSNEIKIGEKS